MVKTIPEYNNWTRGELAKKMRGRDDIEIYNAGLEKQQNFDTDIQGSISYRLGNTFLGETKDNKKAFLYEFIFNEAEAYVLEFTDKVLRFWTVNGLVESAPSTPLEIVTEFEEADLPELKITQSADILLIAHRNYNPYKLTRTGANTFTLAKHTLTGTIPTGLDWTNADNYPDAIGFFEGRLLYAGTNANPQTIYGSQTFEIDNFTQGTDDDDGYQYSIASEKKNRIRWIAATADVAIIGTQGGHFELSGAGTTTGVTPINVKITRTTSDACANITPLNINNIVMYLKSGSEVIESYEYSLENDGNLSLDRTVLSEDITRSGITQLKFLNGNIDYLIMPFNDGRAAKLIWKPEQSVFAWNDMKTDGKYISFAVLPQEIGSNRLIQCVEREINGSTKYYIELQADNYRLPDIENFFTSEDNKISDNESFKHELWEAQKEYIYVDSSLTYNGLDIGRDANADLTVVVNVADSINAPITSTQPVFTATMVNNQIRLKGGNGWATITEYVSTTQVNCTIDVVFDTTTLLAGEYYITANTLTGLDHLEGKEVSVCADGSSQPRKTVVSGSIMIGETDEVQASVIHVGLPYNGIGKTLNIPVGGPNGSGQARRKNLKNIYVQFLDTIGAKVGTDIYELEELQLFKVSDNGIANNMDRPPQPFNGYFKVNAPERTTRTKNIIVLKDDPTPCTVQQIIPEVNMTN